LIKKFGFNGNKSKAFISFHNQLSVDIIVDNGQQLIVSQIPVIVYPLKVVVPQDMSSVNYSLDKLIVKSDDSNLRAKFPLNQKKRKLNNFGPYVNRNQLYEWVKTVTINNKY